MFTCATATLVVVGKRSVEVVRQVLGETFNGWLMRDGFWAYRDLDQRLRCLAHLIRKAQALEDDLEPAAQRFGADLLTVIATVMAAVYDARGASPGRCVHGMRRCSTPCWMSACVKSMRRMRRCVRWRASCSMSTRLMWEFPRAAMDVELKRGRKAVHRFLDTTYGQCTWTHAPLHD